jgi:hypothetical protein
MTRVSGLRTVAARDFEWLRLARRVLRKECMKLLAFPFTPRPRDEGLRLLVDVQVAIGAVEPELRAMLLRHVRRIAECLFEVSGGVSLASADQLLASAHAECVACAARLEKTEHHQGRAKGAIIRLELLLAERHDAVRVHRRPSAPRFEKMPRRVFH